jgi:hypothetical protein
MLNGKPTEQLKQDIERQNDKVEYELADLGNEVFDDSLIGNGQDEKTK